MTLGPGHVDGTRVHGPKLSLSGFSDLTWTELLDELLVAHGENEALVFDDPLRRDTVRWSYDDLCHQTYLVSTGLQRGGVGRGDRVGILMGNRPEAIASLFGIAWRGATPVMLSTFASIAELSSMISRAHVGTVLTQSELLRRRFEDDLVRVQEQTGKPLDVIAVGTRSWDDFTSGDLPGDFDAGTSRPDDEGLIIFSSGTTAEPKGIVHSHRAAVLQCWLQAEIFRRTPETRMWAALPMFWTAGLNSAMGATLAAGGCWVMQETFEPGAALALMERERVTEPYALPHQTAAMVEHPAWATADLSSLKQVYGKSAFARHPTVRGDTTWNNPVGYGLSETCAFFSAHDASTPREQLRASYGHLLPGNELRVLDPDTDEELGAGQEGIFAIKGPTTMLGYLGVDPAATFDDQGFYRTGDVGHYDDAGELHYAGRQSEMIKTSGANVSPAEVEVQLRAMPEIKVARIVGVPDERRDEVVVACITPVAGSELTADDVTSFLRDRVASYKVPKHVLFFADGEIPMTSAGSKVRDPELVALATERLAHEPAPTPGAP